MGRISVYVVSQCYLQPVISLIGSGYFEVKKRVLLLCYQSLGGIEVRARVRIWYFGINGESSSIKVTFEVQAQNSKQEHSNQCKAR